MSLIISIVVSVVVYIWFYLGTYNTCIYKQVFENGFFAIVSGGVTFIAIEFFNNLLGCS